MTKHSFLALSTSTPLTALGALALLQIGAFGCSSTDENGTGSGGGSGTVVATGGTSPVGPGVGGDSTTGGGPGAGGGAPTAGGSPGSGGVPAAGGGPSSGGVPAAGGGPGSGGVPTAGGSPGAGGDGTGGNDGGDGGSTASTCTDDNEKKFSMFAASNAALIELSGNADGFGGDLRYPDGETDGLKGADAICQAIAELSSSCQSSKVWKAFLSTSTVDAIDNIPEGPYYDRIGRFVAADKAELISEDRPPNADSAIANDFPNEDGVPNHKPNGDGKEVDNHEFITGTGDDGRLYAVDDGAGSGCGPNREEDWSVAGATCEDWTNNGASGCPRVGHSWGSNISGMNWMSVYNEGGCLPGGTLEQTGGLDGTRTIGSAGGYGGFFCFSTGEE